MSGDICIDCGICVKKCVCKAMTIMDLPKNVEQKMVHNYGRNSFKLYNLPIPYSGKVLGLVGPNKIGKSTALKILAGQQKPNFGCYSNLPEWTQIISNFENDDLKQYFSNIVKSNVKVLLKPQFISQIPKVIHGTVQELLNKKDEMKNQAHVCKMLDLMHISNRNINTLSGGELQRLACATVSIQNGKVLLFDELSSHLDIKQRLNVAVLVRSLAHSDKYIVVVEHDLAILDYLSDSICCLYGASGSYGIVTIPFSVREGINIYVNGFDPIENVLFRETSYMINLEKTDKEKKTEIKKYHYPNIVKTIDNFRLSIESGTFTDNEILVLLGENGTGKTTFIKILAGNLTPDNTSGNMPLLNTSVKHQKLNPKSQRTVENCLKKVMGNDYAYPYFYNNVLKPLKIDNIMDKKIQNLSGGELQRVALVICLGKNADIYLIDEPSAYLDSEQRLIFAKVLKGFIMHKKKACIVAEHDFIIATYLADRVIVFSGVPSINAVAHNPQTALNGMNMFLELLSKSFQHTSKSPKTSLKKNLLTNNKGKFSTGYYSFLEE